MRWVRRCLFYQVSQTLIKSFPRRIFVLIFRLVCCWQMPQCGCGGGWVCIGRCWDAWGALLIATALFMMPRGFQPNIAVENDSIFYSKKPTRKGYSSPKGNVQRLTFYFLSAHKTCFHYLNKTLHFPNSFTKCNHAQTWIFHILCSRFSNASLNNSTWTSRDI